MGTYYLAHHGVIEQKWGVRRGPPYPLARTVDGRLNSAAQAKRKSASTQNSKLSTQTYGSFRKTPAEREVLKAEREARKARKAQEKQAAKEAKEQQKKAREEEAKAAKEAAKRLLEEQARKAEADEKEALRQYIRHNPRQIYKFADAFTPEEMQSLVQQINLDRKVKDVRDEEIYRAKRYVEQGVSILQTIANGSEQAIKLYNAAQGIWNAVETTNAKKQNREPHLLPRIGGNKEDKDGKGDKNQGGNKGNNLNNEQPKKDNTGDQKQNDQQPKKDNNANSQKTDQTPKTDTASKPTENNSGNKQKRSYAGIDHDTVKTYYEQFDKTVRAYSNATPKQRRKFENEWQNVVKNMDASDLSKPLSSVTDEKTVKAQAINEVLRWFATNEPPKNKG